MHIHIPTISNRNPNQHDRIEPHPAHGAVAALFGAARPGGDLVRRAGLGGGVVGAALQRADEQAGKDLAGLVAVADVFEGFGCVLAADVEEDFFSTSVRKTLVYLESKVGIVSDVELV